MNQDSIAAEAAVLGSMILDWNCAVDMVSTLDVEDFMEPALREVAEKIWELYDKGYDNVDAVVLGQSFDNLGEIGIEGCKGVNWLARIAESVPTAVNAQYYADSVKKNARKRGLVTASERIIDIAKEGKDPDTALEEIQKVIDGLTVAEEDGIYTFAEALHSTIDAEPEKPIKTGFYELDFMSPVLPSDFIIIGARPGHGKTALAITMARHIAEHYGTVLFFSIEMSHQRVTSRAMTYESGQNWKDNLDVQCEMSGLPLKIIDKSYVSTKTIDSVIKMEQKTSEIKAVFIDHFNLMMGSKESNALAEKSNKLRLIAKSLNVPVFLLSQVRKLQPNQTGRPRQSDLFGTSALEQDPTAIWMLHRVDEDNKYESDYEPNYEADIYVDKNRDGMTGRVKLDFCQEVYTFKNKG